jgi:hypothetical protein
VLARAYWTYKRSFNAVKSATLDTYIRNKVYSNDEMYQEIEAFDEIRPKMVT